MNSLKFKTINEAWSHIASNVLTNGEVVSGTRELSNVCFEIEDINENILTVRDKFALHYYLGEMIWYASGANDVRFISKYGKIWQKLSDDGKTNNSAYGYILQYKHDFNQIDKMIELLKKDPTSRRAVMNINIPNENVIETKDEMCTIALQLLLRDGKLNMTGIMRSNDMTTGTPYDIYYFTEIQKYIANKLKVEYGTYTHFVTSIHVYDRDVETVSNSISNQRKNITKSVKINGQVILNYGSVMYKELKNVPKENIKKETLRVCEKYGAI